MTDDFGGVRSLMHVHALDADVAQKVCVDRRRSGLAMTFLCFQILDSIGFKLLY